MEEEEEGGEDFEANAIEIGTVWNVAAVECGKVTPHTTYRTDVKTDVKVGGVDKGEMIQITLDSGAGASCWPAELLPEVPMKPKLKGVRFRAASGKDLHYHGRKDILLKPARGGTP